MQLLFCMCIAGSMGFGSAGSKQRTHHIHSTSSLCIAFPLWPPPVPLCPGSFPGRCCAAVHAQSSSYHSVIPLRLGTQLQTVSLAAHTFMLHAALCLAASINHRALHAHLQQRMPSLQQQVKFMHCSCGNGMHGHCQQSYH